LTSISLYKTGFDDDKYSFLALVANSDGLTGLIAAGSSIGATVTFVFLLFLGNKIPKNQEILLSALFYFFGALLESLSGSVPWRTANGLILLITGRLLYGVGVALTFHSVPEYISEISPKIGRGSICSVTEAMVVIGICLGFLVGYLNDTENGYIATYRVGYAIALVMGGLAMFLPKSPLWLVKNGADDEELLDALRHTQPSATLELVADLKRVHDAGIALKTQWKNKLITRLESILDKGCGTHILHKLPSEVKVLLMSRTLRRCLLLSLLLVFLQQFSGQGAILYYSGKIFGEICPTSPSDCIIGLGMVKLFFVVIMVFTADLFGRRKFLIAGAAFMTVGLIMFCVGLSRKLYLVALIGIYLSAAANEVSLATLLWVVLCEIFPQFVRSAAISIAVATFFAWSSIVILILPYMVEKVDLLAVFIMYTVTGGISVILLFLFVPETRGVDIEISYKLVNRRMEKTLKFCGFDIARNQPEELIPEILDERDNVSSRPSQADIGTYNSI
jgi:MFS family permease